MIPPLPWLRCLHLQPLASSSHPIFSFLTSWYPPCTPSPYDLIACLHWGLSPCCWLYQAVLDISSTRCPPYGGKGLRAGSLSTIAILNCCQLRGVWCLHKVPLGILNRLRSPLVNTFVDWQGQTTAVLHTGAVSAICTNRLWEACSCYRMRSYQESQYSIRQDRYIQLRTQLRSSFRWYHLWRPWAGGWALETNHLLEDASWLIAYLPLNSSPSSHSSHSYTQFIWEASRVTWMQDDWLPPKSAVWLCGKCNNTMLGMWTQQYLWKVREMHLFSDFVSWSWLCCKPQKLTGLGYGVGWFTLGSKIIRW